MNPIPITPEQLKDIDRVALAEHLIASGRYLRFILGYLPEWRPFFREYAADLPELERKLCGELDAESQFVVHRAIKQYELLLAAEDAAGRRLDRYDILVDGDFFLSDKERIIRQAVATGAPLPWESPEENGAAYLDKLVFPLEKRHLLTYDCMRLGFGLEYIPQHCRDIKGKDVIDGGGFVGDSALTYYRYHPRKIYSFEPNPSAFSTLQDVIRLNGREKEIVPVSSALAGEPGIFPFYAFAAEDGSASFRVQERKPTIDVQATTIDEFVFQNDLCPGFISLDVEGIEYAVIQGAVETIRKFKPILSISTYHHPIDFFEIKPFLEKLSLGYKSCFRTLSFSFPNVEFRLIVYVE